MSIRNWVAQSTPGARNYQRSEIIRSDGTVRVGLDYETDYERGPVDEHFEWRIEGKGVILASYRLKANALPH